MKSIYLKLSGPDLKGESSDKDHGQWIELISMLKQVTGWGSWLIVATFFFALIWCRVDSTFEASLPDAWAAWLYEFFEVTSDEAAFDVLLWSTSLLVVLGVHLLLLAGVALRKRRVALPRFLRARQAVLRAVGWTCWILVSAFALSVLADEVILRSGRKLTRDDGMLFAGYAATVVGVAVLHWVVLRVMRQRRCQ